MPWICIKDCLPAARHIKHVAAISALVGVVPLPYACYQSCHFVWRGAIPPAPPIPYQPVGAPLVPQTIQLPTYIPDSVPSACWSGTGYDNNRPACTATSVPEPSAVLVMGFALVALALVRWRIRA